MLQRKMFGFLAVSVILLIPIVLQADPIKINLIFDGVSSSDTWSWAGGAGSTLTAKASSVTVQLIGTPTVVTLPGSTITFTSGPATSGTGTPSSTFVWGPSGNITVTGCGGTCFTGDFTGAQSASTEVGVNGITGLEFDSVAVKGTFNPMVYSLLGLPTTTPLNILGNQTSNLGYTSPASFSAGGHGITAAGSELDEVQSTSATPEPASLVLFGIGLVGLGFIIRRKRPA